MREKDNLDQLRKSAKLNTYIFSGISFILHQIAIYLFNQNPYHWYEISQIPLLLVGFAFTLSMVNLTVNCSIFIYDMKMKGQVSSKKMLSRMLLLLLPFLFMLKGLIFHPTLYALPCLGVFYIVVCHILDVREENAMRMKKFLYLL